MKKNTIQKMWIAIAFAAFALASLVGCKTTEQKVEAEIPVQVAAVQQTDISRMVTTEGVIFPIAQSMITPKVSSPVRKFYVVRGQKVRKGQLLAELENRDLFGAKVDNQGAYEQAQATYATSIGATLPEDIQKANLDVQTAQKARDAAQKMYSSRELLYQQGALPRKELDDAGVTLAQASSQYDQAKKHLDSLNAIVRQQTMKSAEGQLTSAKGKFLAAEAQFSYTEIRSPIDGWVTDRPLYPGEMASSSAPLVTVMNLSNIKAVAHIPQSDALLLHNGDKATITVAGLDPVDGTVTLVSPALDPNSTTVEIWVQARNADQQLRPGTTAHLAITTQTAHNALVIPTSALLEPNANKATVMVVDSQSRAQSRDVETGIGTDQQVQIVSGLKPGEQVISQGAYGLPDQKEAESRNLIWPLKVKVEKPAATEGETEKQDDEKKDDTSVKDQSDSGKDKSTDKSKGQDKGKAKPDAGKKKQ
ncbi:MAG TPA: efflux RND transporter periplasmic adaptor subunit [Candidatus Angelobacter sp.]